MSNIFIATLLALYALVMSVFLISENRRVQLTLAWMLVLFFAGPESGLLIIFSLAEIPKLSANVTSS